MGQPYTHGSTVIIVSDSSLTNRIYSGLISSKDADEKGIGCLELDLYCHLTRFRYIRNFVKFECGLLCIQYILVQPLH